MARYAEPSWVLPVCGALASCTGEAATLPIDVIKIRLQLQGQTLAAGGAQSGMLSTARAIAQKEGIRGFFKGLTPGLLRQSSYQSIKMGLYEPMRDYLEHQALPWSKEGRVTLIDRIICGGGSGSIGAAIANPTDLIKVRMQADTAGTKYRSTIHAFASVVRKEGVLALWKGVLPNIQRAFVVNAAELGTYDTAKTFLIEHEILGDTLFNHFVSSFAAGFVAACVSCPVDLTKTRLMTQPVDAAGRGTLYNGMLHCFVKTAKSEGILGLWAGFFPTWLRIGPWSVIFFVTFERYRIWTNQLLDD